MDESDLAAAWPLTDPTLRLVLAQEWVWTHRHRSIIGHNRDWDLIARGLAACPSEHGFWPELALEWVTRWQKTWKGFNSRTWAAWDQPEVVALDLEIVTFMESDGTPVRFEPGRAAFARRFALRHGDDGWKVASINGDQIFEPGWPPSVQSL